MKKPEENRAIKRIVTERVKTFPDSLVVHINNKANGYTKEDLIEEIQKESPVGRKIISVELDFLR